MPPDADRDKANRAVKLLVLKAVERLAKKTDMRGGYVGSLWRLEIDLLLQVAIEERCLDIDRVKFPVEKVGNCKENSS
jgi:hypothetical protein